jgi:hypothetical protein
VVIAAAVVAAAVVVAAVVVASVVVPVIVAAVVAAVVERRQHVACSSNCSVVYVYVSFDGTSQLTSYQCNGSSTAAEACSTVCQLNYDPVCGTDGTTYSNRCQLQSSNCVKKQNVTVAYEGACTQAAEACSTVCQLNYDPVCGTDGTTYSNRCQLQSSNCVKKENVTVAYDGACTQDAGSPATQPPPPGNVTRRGENGDAGLVAAPSDSASTPSTSNIDNTSSTYECPPMRGFGPCGYNCTVDTDCNSTQKCCQTGCGARCRVARSVIPKD